MGVEELEAGGVLGELHVELHGLGARPGHRVVDEDGGASGDACVDAGVEGVEGGGVDVVVVVVDLVEVVGGVAVDDGDAGAGGEIVELVEGDLLPVGVEQVVGIGVAVEPGERGKLFGVEGLGFAVADVALLGGLGGVDAAVVLEVELVLPGRNADFAVGAGGRRGVALGDRVVVPGGRVGVEVRLDVVEVVLGGAVAHDGDGGVRLVAFRSIQ